MKVFEMKKKKLLIVALLSLLYSCATLKIEPVNFGWPLENALEIRGDFNVTSMRYAVTLNLREVFAAENKIKNNEPTVKQVRIIRDNAGYYYITAATFKHVYIFKPAEKSLVLENKITINEKGVAKPAFNQRGKYIELVTENGRKRYRLTKDGIL